MSGSSSEDSKPIRHTGPGWGVLAALLALAALTRLPRLTHNGLWTDELSTLESIRLPFRELIAERMANGHFPTYFLLLKAWTGLAGQGEWALRLPSAILGILAVPLLYWTALRAWGPRAAAFASLLFLLNERMVWASQEIRPYALTVLAAAGSLHALIHALERGRGSWWMAYGAWSLLGLLCHGTYPFVFVSQAAAVGVWLGRNRRWRWDWAASSAALLAAAVAALAILSRVQINQEFYEPRRWPAWPVYREGLLDLCWGEYDVLFGSGFKYLGLPLAAALAGMAWRARGIRNQPEPREARALPRAPVFALAAAWTVSVLLGMAVVSGLCRNVIGGLRYYAMGSGGAALLGGLAIAGLAGRRGRWALLTAALTIQAAISAAWLLRPGEQAREAVRYVARWRAPDEPVVICNDSHARTLADYYGLGVPPCPLSRNIRDPAEIERFLEENVGRGPGFWLLLYKEKDSPLAIVARLWSRGRFDMAAPVDFREARVRHYQRSKTAQPH